MEDIRGRKLQQKMLESNPLNWQETAQSQSLLIENQDTIQNVVEKRKGGTIYFWHQ